MAHMAVNGFDEVLKKLEKLSNQGEVENIAKKAVNSAFPELQSSVQGAISSSVSAASWDSNPVTVVPSDTKINEYGVYKVAKIGGITSEGTRVAALAAYLEYGIPTHKWGNNTVSMPAHQWRAKAAKSAEPGCQKQIEELLKGEMGLE